MADQFRTGLDWENVRVFVALARHGSLSSAARALRVNHATVARRVHALEEELGEKLVERRPDGYVLTPAGTRLLIPASDMEAAAAVLHRGGSNEAPTGLIRINAPPSLSVGFLIERLAALAPVNPALDVEISTDLRAVSLDRRETDIALRLGKPEDGDVIAKPVVTWGFGFYGTAEDAAKLRKGVNPVFVGFDEANAHVPEAVWLARNFPRARISFRTNNHLAQSIATKAGAGISLLPHFIGRKAPELRLCKLDPSPPSRRMWMLTRRQDRKDLAIHTVTEHLLSIFNAEAALFE